MTVSVWTPEKSQRLLELVQQGYSNVKIGYLLNVTPEAASKQRGRLGFPTPSNRWTAEDNKQLAVLWCEGHSASQIANKMGKTRNAVIGRVSRMKLPMRQTTVRASAQNYQKVRQRANALRKEPRKPKMLPAYLCNPTPEIIPIDTNLPAKLFKLFDWPNTGCRWVYDAPDGSLKYGCTCERIPGQSYCSGHHARVFTAAPVKPRPSHQKVREFA